MDDRIDGAEGDDDEGGERELLATIRAMQEEMATSPSYSARFVRAPSRSVFAS